MSSIMLALGNRVYEIIPLLKKWEWHVPRTKLIRRARGRKANLGQEDCRWVIDHQAEIPAELQRIILVFTNWRHPNHRECVAYLRWDDGQWKLSWKHLDNSWFRNIHLIRRRT